LHILQDGIGQSFMELQPVPLCILLLLCIFFDLLLYHGEIALLLLAALHSFFNYKLKMTLSISYCKFFLESQK